jgi:hypothetical protein
LSGWPMIRLRAQIIQSLSRILCIALAAVILGAIGIFIILHH